jgi:capsid protein
VKGEGWLIRTMRGTRSVWRMVDPCRIKNPDNKPNSATLRDGFQLDTDGAVIGVWVVRSKLGKWGMPEDGKAIFVPWNAADGTPNIVYRKGYQLPGMMRAVSRLAPMIVLSRQIKGVVESHVAAKRLQAIYGMVTEAESPEAYAEAVAAGTALNPAALEVNGPLCAWVIPTGGKVTFTDTKFNGADLKDFLTICYKIQCATVATPVDVVLCQMGEASLSSARAGLDQFDRTCQAEQDAHIAECSSVIDHAAIMDEVATGAIAPLVGDPADTLAAKYSRPAKYSTDRLKDANTIDALMKSGVSGTTAFAMFGLIYEDEREVAAAERGFESAQGTTATQQKDAAFIERVVAANEKINAAGIESLEWPIVVAAGAADTAPGAFIGALAKPDATGAPTSEPGQPATPATAPAQTAAPATEGQTTSARSWWRAAIARVRGQRFAA